jgi:hypothetical protein
MVEGTYQKERVKMNKVNKSGNKIYGNSDARKSGFAGLPKKKWEPVAEQVRFAAPTAPDWGCCPLAISTSACPASGFRANIVMVFGFPHSCLRNNVSV